MILLDYLYYQFTNFYKYFENDGTHKGSGIILLIGMLSWNMGLLIILVEHYYKVNIVIDGNKYYLILYALPIVLLIGIRYWKFTSYDEIKSKVRKMSNLKKILLDIFVIIYSIISFPVMIYIILKISAH